MSFETIDVRDRGPVRAIYHNRPEKRNAESQQLLEELDAALDAAEADGAVRVVVIGGHGDHFSAGHDLKEGAAVRLKFSLEERWEYETRLYTGLCMKVWDMPKPTIARVQGACVAGGFMLANMCDLVVAADDAFFVDPVVQTLSLAGTEVLIHPWVMGLRKAKEMLYTGRRMSASEAYEIGMINNCVPRADLDATVDALADKIAEAPPFALRMMKRSLNRTADLQGFRNALSAHFELHLMTHYTREREDIKKKGLESSIAKVRGG